MTARCYALFSAVVALSFVTCPTRGAEATSPGTEFDLLIKGGTVYDGAGGEGRAADVTVRGDRITGIGDFHNASAKNVIDARWLAIAPFVLLRYSTVISTIRAKMSGRSRWALSALKVNFPNGERP